MTFLLNLLIGFSTILVVSAVENASLANTFAWVLGGAQGSPTGNPPGCCDTSTVNDCPPGSVPCSSPTAQSSLKSLSSGSVVNPNFSFLT